MADSPEPPGMQQDLPKDGSLEMFLPDCDILIHLKMKVQFFLESTPEIRGGTVDGRRVERGEGNLIWYRLGVRTL